MKLYTFTFAFFATLASFGQAGKFDLVIKNAKLFDSRTGAVALNQTILIKKGVISKVTSHQRNYPADKTIDAGGKLVTPGFIDTHIHPTDVYRSYGVLPEYLPKDSLEFYRRRL